MQNFKLFLVVFFLFLNSLCAAAIEQAKIQKDEILSLQDCVAIAINNSPVIRKYEYNLQVANSNVGIAKSAYFPTLGVNAGFYQDYNSNKDFDDGANHRYLPTVGVYLNQLIWNFGKTSALIKMEHFYKLAAEYQFMDSICNTIYHVKTHYFEVLKAKAVVEIEQNNVLINEQNLARAKKLYDEKKKSKIDLANAQVFLSEAQMRLIEAQNDYNQAFADLGNCLYIAYSPDFQIKSTDTFNYHDVFLPTFLPTVSDKKRENIKDFEKESNIVDVALKSKVEKTDFSRFKQLPFSLDEAYGLAYKNSPDLWVLESTLDAMKESVLYIKRQYYPDLVGNAGYNFNNTKTMSNSNFNLGVNMVSAVNMKQLKHEIDRANAQVNLAQNDIDLFKQDLYFEVKKCFLNVEKSKKQISKAKQKTQEALENLEIANKQYNEGKADYIALQEARKNYNEAKILYVSNIYDYNISLANLEIAMHYHLDDLHSQAEHALHYHYKEIIDKLEASLHCEHKHDEKNK